MRKTAVVFILLLGSAFAFAQAATHGSAPLNLAPTGTANAMTPSGGNGLLNSTKPVALYPTAAPSPLHIAVSCIDSTGNMTSPSDPRYDACISEAQGRGPKPVGAQGSSQAISLSVGR